jgi:hypothetical protein
LFVLLISPFVWGLVSVATTHRVPAAVKDVRQLATQIRPHVADGKLVTYLADCEERIQAGRLAPSNCVPPWASSLPAPHHLVQSAATYDGTNLCVDASLVTKHGTMELRLSLESSVHPKGNEANYVLMVTPDCSIRIPREPQ